MSINDREYWSGSTKWTIHRNWQRRSHKTKKTTIKKKQKTNTMCAGHHYPQANTNNVNKTWALLHKTGGKDERTSFCMWKTQRGTQNVKTNNRRTQKTKMMSNTILMTGKSFVKALHIWVQIVFINIDRNLTALLNQIKTYCNKC